MSSYTVLCTYLVKPDKVEELRGLLGRHWPALRKYGLVTEDPAILYCGESPEGPFFVEIMTWASSSAPGEAYWNEEINEIWAGLYKHTAPRDGRPGIEYPRVERLPDFPRPEEGR